MGEIEIVGISELIPYINNSRTHDETQVAQIAASIREFGFNNPILIDEDNGIIAGHGRLAAAQKLHLDEVPCIRLSHLSDAQKKAYVIADNKIALNAGWDMNILALELQDLQGEIDLSLLGFDADELNQILLDGEIIDMPELPNGDKSELQQITFTIHNEQAFTIKEALQIAKSKLDIASELNENSNGNAIATICELFITQNANS